MPAAHLTILSERLAFWIANCNLEAVPDVVRCNGIVPPTTLETITFFISEKFSDKFRATLSKNSKLAFMGCSLYTFESYQYKGTFLDMRICTQEEEEIQRIYMDAFTDAIEDIGLSKIKFYKAYYHQPSYAITMSVSEVFEQTPRKGTGNAVKIKEDEK